MDFKKFTAGEVRLAIYEELQGHEYYITIDDNIRNFIEREIKKYVSGDFSCIIESRGNNILCSCITMNAHMYLLFDDIDYLYD